MCWIMYTVLNNYMGWSSVKFEQLCLDFITFIIEYKDSQEYEIFMNMKIDINFQVQSVIFGYFIAYICFKNYNKEWQLYLNGFSTYLIFQYSSKSSSWISKAVSIATGFKTGH